MKKLKICMLVIAFALTLFAFSVTTVSAAEINSLGEFEAFFDQGSVSLNGSTLTLNKDVTLGNLLEIMDGEYVLDLNGHTLKIPELYVIKGKLTINDSTQNGKIDTHFVGTEEEGTIVVNRCIFSTDDVEIIDGETYEQNTFIGNVGTLVLNNAIVESGIGNDGNLTIEYAEVPNISQFGTATINGGKFYSLLTFVDDYIKTTISGGIFTGSVEEDSGIIIQSDNEIKENAIMNLLADGYVAEYAEYFLHEPIPNQSECYTAAFGPSVKILNDVDTYSDTFKKITADGTWVIDALAPKNMQDSESLLSAIANNILASTGYHATAYAYGETFNPEKVLVYISNGEQSEEHIVKAKYLESNSNKAQTVNSVLNKMKYYENHEDMKVDNAYILDDLYLINYLFSNTGTSRVSGDQALNFAKDLINVTNGANISFEFVAKAGGGNPNALYTFAKGQVIVYYDGKAFTSRNIALTASHVLYIPNDTKDTDEAFIAAALKRIKDYIGNDANVTITVGGTLDSLSDEYETYNEYNLFDKTTTRNNYYTVKINGKSYNFAICKKEVSKLETPKYVGSNLENKIFITSDATTIPLDTAITVKKVQNDTIKKALGTSEYTAYDISLYSNAKQVSITKLTNGKFKVSIPVPENLKDKEIAIYYISEKGETTEYAIAVKDGFASFETDHFSTYAIAEKLEKDVTPETGSKDNLQLVYIIAITSFIGCIVLKYKKLKID